ncbi:MAG: hypothetical protein DRI57_13880 [Deltaproteobacteria bacterium]|nr:MAG: hypothetical protein DRI57_13880 [Deltaproteobacteria bacterium]
MPPLKLRHKVNWAILATFALIALCFSSIQLPFEHQRLNTVMGKIHILLKTLTERDREDLANEIFEGRVRAVNIRLKEMTKVEGILAISVFDDSGRFLASSGPADSHISSEDQEAAGQGIQIRQEKRNEESVLCYLQQIQVIGEQIGFIRIYYSLADVEREHRLSFMIFASLLICILLTMILILNVILSRTIINPIIYLRDAMHNMRTGMLGGQVDVKNRDEIGDLSKAFNQMSAELADSYQKIETQNVELRRLDRVKDEFLANTSHELRTPLNGIIGLAESLMDGAAGFLDEKVIFNLKMISSSSRRLSSLVNDILDFSKMRHQKLKLSLKPVSLRHTVESVFDLSHPLAESKSLRLINTVAEDLPPVQADENRLLQILHNLTGNAIKFTDSGEIQIEAEQTHYDRIKVRVKDTGVGIPPEKHDAIFRSFEQLDGAADRKFSGAGLGLSITRMLVEAHDGEIGVTSIIGEGSIFFFTLPVFQKDQQEIEPAIPRNFFPEDAKFSSRYLAPALKQEEKKHIPAEAEENSFSEAFPGAPRPESEPLQILVIDDEPINLQVLGNYLKLHQCHVVTAMNGKDALNLLRERESEGQRFDLILLDVMMPGMTGYEVTRRIRRKYNLFEMPVLLLTAMNQPGDLVQGFQSGANDYITKPFYKKELLARMGVHANLRNNYLKLEKQIKEHAAELCKTNEELREAKEIADAATLAKSDFLANMSHEIRTPMNGVIVAADLVMGMDLPPKTEYYLKIIHSSAYSLLEIINKILDFSKIEAGHLDLEMRPFRLDDVMDEVMDIFVNKAPEKQIELLVDIEPGTPMALVGDSLRLKQILTNLVGNAIKFTENQGVVCVGAMCHSQVESGEREVAGPDRIGLKFFVKDTGVGIAAEHLSKVFQPFSQADVGTTRKYGGTGLGLCISRQLVEMMEGEILVESEPGKGSTFCFTAYVGRQPPDQEQTITIPPDMKELNVLVVDDCPDSRIIMEKILRSFDYKVESAASGKEALTRLKKKQIRQKPFDLAIIDWAMPELDGIDTSRIILRNMDPTLPIIVLTSLGKVTGELDVEKVGIKGFLPKPLNASTLFNAIMDVFGKEALENSRQEKRITTKASIYKKYFKDARFLVAEDNPTNQEIILAVLEGAGIDVEIASNGKEAVGMICRNIPMLCPYDAVLMDIQMPEMDGYEATKKIRDWEDEAENREPGNENWKLETRDSGIRIPIIAMTAHAMKGDKEKCLKAGMDGYVSKPVNQDILFHKLWKTVRPLGGTQEVEPQGDTGPDKSAMTSDLPRTLPGINIKHALDALDMEPAAFIRILQGFGRRNKDTVNKIRDAFEMRNWKLLRRLAHSLKGSAGNIGANPLQKASEELESASWEYAKDMVSPPETRGIASPELLTDNVEHALNQVLESLESLDDVPKKVPDQKPPAAPAQLAPILDQLAEALRLADPVEIEKLMEIVGKEIDDSTFRDIEEQISNYNYEEAMEIMKESNLQNCFTVKQNPLCSGIS